MSHKNKKSLIYQAKETLNSMAAYGQSRHQDKLANATQNKIYSFSTMEVYLQHACYFVKYSQKTYHCKTLEDCRPHINKWLQLRIDQGLSASTIKLEAAALAKLYRTTAAEFIPTPNRYRANIKRSRQNAARDKHFSQITQRQLVIFCKCTGLRRREVENICGSALLGPDEKGRYTIQVLNGKGGKKRQVEIVGPPNEQKVIVALMHSAGDEKVFGKVSSAADIHAFRAIYANRVYKRYAKPLEKIKHERFVLYHNKIVLRYSDNHDANWFAHFDYCGRAGYQDCSAVYICRRDLRTIPLDREAMLMVSQNLGHNRPEIFASNYYRPNL